MAPAAKKPAARTTAARKPAAKKAAAKPAARKPTAKKAAPVRKPAAKKPAARKPTTATVAARRRAAAKRTAALSDEVLKSIESGQRQAIDAVHRFLESVDDALPAAGTHPSRREAVIDAALDMADKLVHTQYDFVRNVVKSAEKSLTKK